VSLSSSNDSARQEYSGWPYRLLQVIFRIILYLPWIWIALFALFVLGTAVQVGHLPTYGRPDPKDAGAVSILYMPVLIILLMVMGSSPIGIGLALIKILRDVPPFIRRSEAVLYLAGIILFFFLTGSNFAGLMTWLGD
jgi:ABC-type dipeptide/oligopeptide/nickel transport system permease component